MIDTKGSVLKKFMFIILLAVGIVLGMAAMHSFAATGTYTDTQGVKYTYDTGKLTAKVNANNNVSDNNITIPKVIYIPIQAGITIDYPCTVNEIESGAFQNCANLNKVTIYSSAITSIGNSTFEGCSNLTEVVMPNAITSIGDSAFDGCTSLSSITLSSNITSIGQDAFYNCSSLTSVAIPDGVTTINPRTFSGCNNLSNITIPNSVTLISYSAFENCSSLESVAIPSSVTGIGSGTFKGCSSLLAINVDENNTDFCSDNGVLYNKNKTGLVCYPAGKASNRFIVPNTVTVISSEAFYNCGNLKDVFVPSNTAINYDTFVGTTANVWNYVVLDDQTGAPAGKTLVKITGKYRGVGTSVACDAMGSEYVIRSVELNDVNLIHNCNSASGTFDYTDSNNITWTCKILEAAGAADGKVSIAPKDKSLISGAVEIPSTVSNGCYDYNVTTIAESAFRYCSGLTNMTIPSSVTSIGNHAFDGCTGLTSVTIPEGVTTIAEAAFYECCRLTSVTIPSSVTTIGGHAFYGCTDLTSVTIPEGVTSIEVSTFSGCTGLTSVTIPSSVTTIGSYAFCNCSSLTSVTIPEGVTTIGSYAFDSCTGLTSITIPSSVTTINTYAFAACSNLTDAFVPSDTTVDIFAFKNTSVNVWRYEVLEDQTGAPAGKTLVKITGRDQGDGTAVACDAMGSEYVIRSVEASGVNLIHNCNSVEDTFDYTDSNNITWTCTILEAAGNTAGSVSIIPKDRSLISGAVEIPSTVQNDCNLNFTVTTIGTQAFEDCSNLTSVMIPDGVTSIKGNVFRRCSNLMSVTIPNGVTSISNYTFEGCISLTSVTIPEGVKTIANHVFQNCSSLTSVTIPSSVTEIRTYAFANCGSLVDTFVPSAVIVGNNAFNETPANVWRYEVLEDQTGAPAGKTLVKITGKDQGDGTSVACDAMNNGYVIDSVEVENIQLSHTLTSHAEHAATCTEAGNSAYWSCSECGKYFSDAAGTTEIEADSWVIAPGHNLEEHAAVEATCTTAGNNEYWSCSKCGNYFSDANGENEIAENSWVIPATGHNYGSPTYSWAQENGSWKCTARRVCGNNASHVETEDGTITSEVTTAATCEVVGTTRYTATFTNEAFAEQTKDVEDIEALGHDWGAPTYVWAQDNSTCTATRACQREGCNEIETETVTASSEVKTPATCEGAGTTTYTATFENEVFETQTQDVEDIEAIGHDWGVPTYVWTQDNSACTATRVCANDASHVETEDGTITSEVTTAATCEVAGTTTYTATFANEAFAEQTKYVEDIEAIGHDWGVPTYVWAQDNSTCTATRVCGNDNSHVETETVTASITTTAATCTDPGVKTYTAKFENSAFEQQIKKDTEATTGHSWGAVSYTWAADKSTCKAERVCTVCNEKEEETVTTTNEVTTAETCTEDGIRTYTTALFTNQAFTTQTTTETIPATGHVSPLEIHVANSATCTEAGNSAYWSCSQCGKYFSDANGENEIAENSWVIPIDVNAHAWGDTTYEWTQENGSWKCTATRVCQNDATHKEEIGTATVSGYTEKYDENAHGLTVTNNIPGATILYSTDVGDNKTWSEIAPVYTTSGNYTIYVKVQDDENYVTATVKIIEPGDVNEDGSIDILDLQTIFNYVAGYIDLNIKQIHYGDCNENGIINILDLQALYIKVVANS